MECPVCHDEISCDADAVVTHFSSKHDKCKIIDMASDKTSRMFSYDNKHHNTDLHWNPTILKKQNMYFLLDVHAIGNNFIVNLFRIAQRTCTKTIPARLAVTALNTTCSTFLRNVPLFDQFQNNVDQLIFHRKLCHMENNMKSIVIFIHIQNM